MLRIFANTWGNYNENGADGGEWITLPMNADELEETLERIAENMGDHDPEWFINDYEWEADHLGSVGENDSIFEWNEIAERLEDLDDYDLEKLEAIQEVEGGDLVDNLEDLDNYEFYSGVSLEEYAEEIVNDCYNLPEFALYYFDFGAFARDLSFDGYHETENGVLYRC